MLGRLDAEMPLAGGLRLDAEAAGGRRRVAGRVPQTWRRPRPGIVAVANQEMVRAIRVVSVERGHDPRGLELVAFGGAGPLHACEVADALGIRPVLVPAAGGVLSALGIAACERRRDAVRGVMRPLAELTAPESCGRWCRGCRDERGGAREAAADLRYRGQGFELSVPLEPLRTLAERFHERHQRSGSGSPTASGEIELINLRAASTVPGAGVGAVARQAAAGRQRPRPRRISTERPCGWRGLDGAGRRDGTWRVTR